MVTTLCVYKIVDTNSYNLQIMMCGYPVSVYDFTVNVNSDETVCVQIFLFRFLILSDYPLHTYIP